MTERDESGGALYPEHDRLTAVMSERDAVQDFLDWMQSEGYVVARYGHRNGYGDIHNPNTLYEASMQEFRPRTDAQSDPSSGEYREPQHARGPLFETLIGRYFGIDPEKLSAEKDSMLAAFREAHRAR